MLMGALALMGAATPSMALFTNGGFETGTFEGWNLKWGKTTNGAYPVGGNWNSKVTWVGSLVSGVGNEFPTTGPTGKGPLFLHAGVVNWNAPDPIVPTFSTATPPLGLPGINTKKAILNVRPNRTDDYLLGGDWDVTQISQTSVITAADFKQPNGTYTVSVYWGTVLTDPQDDGGIYGHLEPEEQPFVNVSIEARKSAGAAPYKSFNEHYTTDKGAINDWKAPPGRPAEFYKELVNKLEGLVEGDIVTIVITTGDCGKGAHGGYTYLDNAGTADLGTIEPPLASDPPCLYGEKGVFVGNNNNVTSNIGSSGYVQVQMGAKVTGDIISTGKTLYQNWQKPLAFYNNVTVTGTAKTAYSSAYKDPTAIVTGGITTGYAKTYLPLVPQVVTIGTANIYPPTNGSIYTLAPGRYKNLMANPGAVLKLTAGTYEFNEFQATGTKITLDVSAGPIKIKVKTFLNLSTGTTTTSLNGSFTDLPSREITWYSNGRLSIGNNTKLSGLFTAPFNQDWDQLGTNVTLVGRLRASTINISTGAIVTCKDK